MILPALPSELILLRFSCSVKWFLFLLAFRSCRLCISSPEYHHQLDFSPLTAFTGVRKWVSTDSARLHRSTSCERIWLPVSFPLKFSKSHRLSMLLHIQATRTKLSITQLFIKVTLLPPSASPELLQGWRLQGVFQTVMYHPYMVSTSVVVHRESQPLPFSSNAVLDC